jgi:hypothetical protein
MGLHTIAEDGSTFGYHCHNKNCRFHNCANWETWQKCAHHDAVEHVVVPADEMRKRMQGAIAPEMLARMTDAIITQKTTAGRTDGETRQLSIDDPGIEWVDERHVALPVCECGTRMTLKVVFTDEEMKAPNIQIAVRDPQNPSLITRLDQHPMVSRHQSLATALQAKGNVYTPPDTAAQEAAQREQHKALILEVLKEQGVVPRALDTTS